MVQPRNLYPHQMDGPLLPYTSRSMSTHCDPSVQLDSVELDLAEILITSLRTHLLLLLRPINLISTFPYPQITIPSPPLPLPLPYRLFPSPPW